VRDFWRGALPDVRDLAYRLSGSSDRYARPGRHPRAAVNFVTAHDGFTLRDLVSYDRKHNEANGEDGRDGADVNRSWNCGAEGDTADPRVAALRRRQARNLLATLLLATGVPMLTAGDELGRTQRGNNNAYCQDNELSWLDWSPAADPAGRSLLALATRLIRLRRATPALRRTAFFTGRPGPDGLPDVAWFRPGGGQLTEADWYAPSRTLGVYLRGEGGAPALMLLLHAGEEPLDFHLPGPPWAHGWELLADTARDDQDDAPATAHPAGAPLPLPARSLLVLRARPATP
jgi:glycogen operon protein